MPVVRREISVRCAPERAFDFLVDGRNEARWNPANKAEKLTEGPIRLGTEFQFTLQMMGRRHGIYRVTEFDRAHRFTHTMVSGNLPITVEAQYAFEPASDSTHMTWNFGVRAKAPMWLMTPLIARSMGRSIDTFLVRVKRILEDGPAGNAT